jgi:hypothetical protein
MMGYYTYYKLKLHNDTANKVSNEEIMAQLRTKGSNAAYALKTDGETQEECKWYEHEEDMADISKLYPGVLFELEGEGESGTDIWKKYFENGKIQRCPAKIAYDLYDETKLEEL